MTRARSLLWVLVAAGGVAIAAVIVIAVRCPTVKLDEFLGPVKQQLMRPPPSSEAALVAAAEGRELPAGVLSLGVHDYGWPTGILGSGTAYDAPRSALCLAFTQELGRYDIVRCRYQAHGWQVDLASTAHVTAIRLSGPDLVGDPLDVAQEVARKLFEPKHGVLLRTDGCDGKMTFGSHDLETTGPVPQVMWADFEYWRDTLAWWYQPGQVGFIAIDAPGVPTCRPLPGAAEWANRRWFSDRMFPWTFARELEQLAGPVQKQLMLPPLRQLNAATRALDFKEELPDGVSEVPAGDSTYVPHAIRGLQPAFQVPPSALCLAFEQELDRLDVVRCNYRVDQWSVDVAATAQVVTVSLYDPDGTEAEPLARAQLAAETLFDADLGLALHEEGRVAYFTIGRADADGEATGHTSPTDGGLERRWRDTMTWWYRPGEVGFIVIKSSAHATGQSLPEVTEQANKRWFSKDKPDWFRPRKR